MVTALVAVGLLAGCSSGGTATPSASATETVTASAAPSASASAAPSAPASAEAPGASGSGGSAPAAAAGPGRCDTASLRAGEQAGSGGAAGSTYVHLTLENTGSTTCTLQGWPGVSFVGGGVGEQIGAAATQDRASAHPTVTLAPGQVAVAPLKITNAEDYPPEQCDVTTPDGLRIYPPGSKASLYVKDEGHPACADEDTVILQVQGLVAEGQAVD